MSLLRPTHEWVHELLLEEDLAKRRAIMQRVPFQQRTAVEDMTRQLWHTRHRERRAARLRGRK
jgi:hypothetical protein